MTIPGALFTPLIKKNRVSSYTVDNSIVFNDDDSQYLIKENQSNSTTGGADARKKFTVSLWWKHGNINSGGQNLFIQRNSAANYLKCGIAGTGGNEGALQFFANTLGTFNTGDTSAVLRDFHAWYHILFYYDSTDGTAGDRARIYLNGVRLTDFQTSATNPSSGAITQFGSNNAMVINQQQGGSQYGDGYMAEMVVIDGQALTPSSFTEFDDNGVLRPLDISAQSLTFGDQGFYLEFKNSLGLGQDSSGTSSTTMVQTNTDTTNNELNNGDMSGVTACQRYTALATSKVTSIKWSKSSRGFTNVTCQVQQDDGTGEAPSGTTLTNGEVTGITSSGAGYETVTFPNGGVDVVAGTNYWFCLPSTGIDGLEWGISYDSNGDTGASVTISNSGFSTTRGFGHQLFQEGNIFAAYNSPVQSGDSPTLNAATFSPLMTRHQTSWSTYASDWTFTKGNTTLTHSSGSSGDIMAAATQLLQPGQKYHFEVVTESMQSSTYARFQLALVPESKWQEDASPLTGTNKQFEFSLIKSGGTGSNTATFDDSSLTAPTNKPTTNSRLTFEVDMSTIGSTTVRYYFNGSLDTTYSSMAFDDEPYFVVSYTGVETDRNGVFSFNFGASSFTDTPTTGHVGLTAKAAYEGSVPAIEDGSAYFQSTLYAGNGSSRTITQTENSTFQPDFIWGKQRDGSQEPTVFDAVQGVTKYIQTNSTAAQATQSGVTAFNSNGFDLGTWAVMNESSKNHVAWQWKGAGSSVANEVGSLSSTVNANPTAGFSIVKWTGNGGAGGAQTVGHGLGAKPNMIMIKNISTSDNWVVYHDDIGFNAGTLNSDAARITAGASVYWNDTAHTATIFNVNTNSGVNGREGESDQLIAYCFAEIPGYSRFGKYTGNNSTDGTFVHLGFRPAWVMIKSIDTVESWWIGDSVRYGYNDLNRPMLAANSNGAEETGWSSNPPYDALSNGFKIRRQGGAFNNVQDYLFAAFAVHPFAGTTPGTAR